jgi:hypothetical protein
MSIPLTTSVTDRATPVVLAISSAVNPAALRPIAVVATPSTASAGQTVSLSGADSVGDEDSLTRLTQCLQSRIKLVRREVHHAPMAEVNAFVVGGALAEFCHVSP